MTCSRSATATSEMRGAQNHVLGFTVGQAMEVEVEAGEPHEQEGQPDDGQEEPDPAPESEDLGLKFHMLQAEDLGGNDGTRSTTNPTDGSRAWNTEVLEQARVALLTGEVTHAVVVGAAASGGRHGSWSRQPRRRATVLTSESSANSRVLHLHTRKSGMFWFAAGRRLCLERAWGQAAPTRAGALRHRA